MPQRVFRSEHYGYWHPDYAKVQPLSATDERALARVGLEKGPEEELNWFLRFANLDVGRASHGELLTIQEDLAVIIKVHNLYYTPHLPTRDEILELHALLRKHLAELADEGKSLFPEVVIRQWIIYPRHHARIRARSTGKLDEVPSHIADCVTSDNPTARSLVYMVRLVGRLIEKSKGLVMRCPHCQNLFLQGRRNQEYCGRVCQSVAVMQRLRSAAKASTTSGRKKKGRGHGKKIRR